MSMAATRPCDLWPDWIARGGERSGGGATISWRRDVAICRGSRSSRRNRFETDDASAMLKPFRTAPEAPRLHLRVRTRRHRGGERLPYGRRRFC
jgi:hypothetical protein